MTCTHHKHWPSVALSDLSNIIMGQAPPGEDCNEEGRGVPFVRAGEFGDERPIISQWTIRPLRTARSTDVFICVVGATAGKLNLGADCAIGRSVAAIRCNTEFLESKFLYYFLKTRETSLREASSGSAQGVIQREQLGRELIPLPSRSQQQRIVNKIESIRSRRQRIIERLNKGAPLVEKLRQAILAAAFRGDLTADWRARNPDVEPADKFLERIRAERRRRWEAAELARLTAKGKPPTDERWKDRYPAPVQNAYPDGLDTLPPGWNWARLIDLAFVESGQTPEGIADKANLNGPIPWFRVGDMNLAGNEIVMKHSSVSLSEAQVREFKLHIRRAGTIIFPKRGGAIATNKKRILASPSAYDLNLMGIDPLDGLHQFLWFWFMGLDLRTLGDGSSIPQINHGDIEPLWVPLPPSAEIEAITTTLGAQLDYCRSLANPLAQIQDQLSKLEIAILSKAFRGELVPQDPNDEPASVLLERLRAEIAAAPAKPGRRARASAQADDDPSEPRPAAPSSRRAAATPAPDAPPTSDAAPSQLVPPAPAARTGQQPLPLAVPAVDFLELTAEAQAERVHAVLLGEGPLEREDAVRRAAELLRDAGLVAFQRLRRDGPLAACIDAALSAGLREARFDRPTRGSVRAIVPDPSDVPAPLWRRVLLAALSSPLDADAAVRAAADWAQAQFGLDFKRLRTGGHIDTALRAALAELRAASDVVENGDGLLSVRTRSAT